MKTKSFKEIMEFTRISLAKLNPEITVCKKETPLAICVLCGI